MRVRPWRVRWRCKKVLWIFAVNLGKCEGCLWLWFSSDFWRREGGHEQIILPNSFNSKNLATDWLVKHWLTCRKLQTLQVCWNEIGWYSSWFNIFERFTHVRHTKIFIKATLTVPKSCRLGPACFMICCILGDAYLQSLSFLRRP